MDAYLHKNWHTPQWKARHQGQACRYRVACAGFIKCIRCSRERCHGACVFLLLGLLQRALVEVMTSAPPTLWICNPTMHTQMPLYHHACTYVITPRHQLVYALQGQYVWHAARHACIHCSGRGVYMFSALLPFGSGLRWRSLTRLPIGEIYSKLVVFVLRIFLLQVVELPAQGSGLPTTGQRSKTLVGKRSVTTTPKQPRHM
jgi:hypothetical protein